MAWINRFAGGTRTVKNFLANEILHNGSRSMRILDVGSGACDIPVAVVKWALKRSQRVEFTCLETNETALKIATRNIRKSGLDSIELRHGSIFEFNSGQHFDYAIGSMFFHHFPDEQILALIRRLRSYTLKGILINDLRRNLLSYASCSVLVCPLPKGLRHDALLSIRRGFKADELSRLLSGIEDARVDINIDSFSRLAAFVRFEQRG
jgi:2-polyprenyl-3-methyl-5-hydroxy-6-metoxy-1,4-benzoquinol methylase